MTSVVSTFLCPWDGLSVSSGTAGSNYRVNSPLDVPELHFSVVASDPGFQLEAVPNAVDESRFGITLQSRTNSRLNFVLTPRVSNHDVSTSIAMDVNRPDVKRVVVPVTLLKTPN